jgi:hypothetical protein
MDETLAELFACHLVADCFNGNPMDAFSATIGNSEYGPDEMLVRIRLYGACYTICFEPGESPDCWELLMKSLVYTNVLCVISRD